MFSKVTHPSTRPLVHHTPLLDRAQGWIWPLQVANIRVMRVLRAVPSLIIVPFVLWAAIGWRPWRDANKAIRENTASNFQLNPYWTTFFVVVAVIVIPWILASVIPQEDDFKKTSSGFSIGIRYVFMQLLSDPVGTLCLIAIPLLSGIDWRFWRWKKPWYWRPDLWDWRHIVLTLIAMFVTYYISRVMLKFMEQSAAKHSRRPNWLVLWHKLVMIALLVPDKYSAADRSPKETGDHLGLAQKLPELGSREVGVSPVTSPFGSLSRYPTAKLRTRPAYAKDWYDYEQLIERLFQLLENFAPWRLELQYVHNLSPWGYLVIHFAPPDSAGSLGLIPENLVGPADPPHELRLLSIEERIHRLAPDSDPFDDPSRPAVNHGSPPSAEQPEEAAKPEEQQSDTDMSQSWVSNAQAQLLTELRGRTKVLSEGENS